MNEHDHHHEEADQDRALQRLLAPLRVVGPTLEEQVRTRVAVAEELAWVQRERRPWAGPWWKRRVTIPLPLAAGWMLALGLAVLGAYYQGQRSVGVPNASQVVSAGHAAVPPSKKDAQAAVRNVGDNQLQYFASEVYICGIGKWQSESGYFYQEQ